MKKNQLVLLITFAVAVGFLVLFANRAEPARLGNEPRILTDATSRIGTLLASEPFYDFGAISMSAGKVSHVFKIKNNGTTSVHVKKTYTSCMCTTATLTTKEGTAGPFGMQGHTMIPTISQSIVPNEEASVEAIFDPAAHGPAGVGKVQRVIYLETDASEKPFELTFEATVTS